MYTTILVEKTTYNNNYNDVKFIVIKVYVLEMVTTLFELYKC